MALIVRISRPAPRNSGSMERTGEPIRELHSYNRSSLALEPNESFPQNHFPQAPALIKRQSPLHSNVPLFRDLDQQIAGRSRSTTVVSVIAHCGAVAGILWLAVAFRQNAVRTAQMIVAPITLYAPVPPPPVMHVAKITGGGGGSQAHRLAPPQQEPLPRVEKTPVVLDQVSKIETPKMPEAPSVRINIPDRTINPSFGTPNSPQVAMASEGAGTQNGFGIGLGGGLGAGNGNGHGPGSRAGYGGGIMSVGGGVSAPQVIHSVEPEFTEQARQANYQGTVAIQLVVDSNGNPQDVRVLHHLGMGLDDEAIAAVRQYKFRPAIYEGHPVAVQMIIDVDFRLH